MKVGLALGGGGARGAAHIGVLMELERLGIRPHLIVGTSIGGMIGALYAAGLGMEDILAFFRKLSVSGMYALPGNAPALTSNAKVGKLLEATLGRITFTDLQTPLALITADLVGRHEVVLDEGDLISAILATIAIPIIFPPVERDDQVLIDGGILNNTPFDTARARGATYVIAVDLSNTAPFGTPSEPAPPATGMIARALSITRRRRTWQVLSTVTDIITTRSVDARLAVSRPELFLRPEMGTIGLFDFHRWEEGVAAGRQAVKAVEDQLTAQAEKLSPAPADNNRAEETDGDSGY